MAVNSVMSVASFYPSMKNGQKIIKALRKLTGRNIDFDDFWTMSNDTTDITENDIKK